MEIFINQVGKRWFLCEGKRISVEASYSNKTIFVLNPAKTKKAGYNSYDWIPSRKWTLTGKGADKHRAEITAALEEYLAKSTEANESA